MPYAATWMALDIIILSEMSGKKKTHIIYYCLYMESEKNDTNEVICKM